MGNMKILVVEDDPTLRESLKDIIELEGYQTLIAENGLRGLQFYKEFKPDLVISDIQMPKMDGLKMLEEIRKENTEAIVIIVTAHGSEEYAMRALRLGANNYLKKPFTTEELVFLLRKYDALVENRTIGHEILGMIVRKELTMVFDNRIDLIPKIVDHLVQETANLFGEQERLSVRVGLFELLVNAVE
ncbi:response regulator, partial [bacterium]|nr:response regulator [candidate division CSSED10-310 bacterium]